MKSNNEIWDDTPESDRKTTDTICDNCDKDSFRKRLWIEVYLKKIESNDSLGAAVLADQAVLAFENLFNPNP